MRPHTGQDRLKNMSAVRADSDIEDGAEGPRRTGLLTRPTEVAEV